MKAFIDAVRESAEAIAQQPTAANESTALLSGTVLAESLIEAIRTGDLPAEAVGPALHLIAHTGEQSWVRTRGFLQRIGEEFTR